MLAVGMMAAGTAVSAYGQYQAGKARQQAANYNAAIAERNAEIAKDQADYEADRQASKLRRVVASQRVGYLANGVTVSGSAMDLLSDTVVQGELDRLAILYGGEVEAVNQYAEAARERMAGAAARRAGTIGAFGTLLSGAGQSYGFGKELGVF